MTAREEQPLTVDLDPTLPDARTAWWYRVQLAVSVMVTALAALLVATHGTVPPGTIALLVAVGFAAGVAGAVIGFGTALTLPVLFTLGLPPIVASMTTTLGLVPGSWSAAVAAAPDRRGAAVPLRRFGVAIALGSICGAGLLAIIPASIFRPAADVLIVICLPLIVLQPRIAALLSRRMDAQLARDRTRSAGVGISTVATIAGVGLLGGFYAGGLGLVVLAALTVLVPGTLVELNAAKVTLVAICNSVAALEFVVLVALGRASVDWTVVLLLAVSSILGGLVGPSLVRMMSAQSLTPMRITIVVTTLLALGWSIFA